MPGHIHWGLQLDNNSYLQRDNEDQYGYINIIEKHFTEEDVPQEHYLLNSYNFKEILDTPLSRTKITKRDLENAMHALGTKSTNNQLLYRLKKYNRGIMYAKHSKNTMLKHLWAVGYKRVTFEPNINYENLKKGFPIIIANEDEQYLILPEDLGFKTQFHRGHVYKRKVMYN